VDVVGIAALRGLSIHQARRRKPPPWAEPGHPAPLTTGKPAPGRPQLWDRDQAAAYARGKPIPALPEPGHPDDLLDDAEAAKLAGLTPQTWARYRRAGRLPAINAEVCGAEHWTRRTVEQYKTDREQRAEAPRGGRPPGSTETLPRAEIEPRVQELLDSGETNVAEIARQLGVHYSTALGHVTRLSHK
jgi:DNA-binding transcriptional ArsR family regulator